MKTIDSFTGQYRFLSNFYPSEVELVGVMYPTVEHAYQASKTLIPTEREIIRAAKTPGQAKALGRRVSIVPEWNQIRIGIMRDLLSKKFANKVLRAEIVETGDAQLVEGNYWNDTFWGVCRGKGQNWLGKLLMEVREELKVLRT